jgi:quinol monooxygenase YgiN
MYLVTWIHVRDYDDWKMAFDAGEPLRTMHRCTGHEIFRDADDPNQLTVFLEFPSREAGKAFMADPELKRKMEESGVDSEVRSMFVTQTQRADYRARRAA